MGLGIEPSLLISQVENAASYVFEQEGPFQRRLRAWKDAPPAREEAVSYYALCLSAHWATAGSFIPTDVDNSIRQKLWALNPEPETRLAMAELVVESLSWDYSGVTAKLAVAPSGAKLSTHEGTWFSVAVGAYAALRDCGSPKAEEIVEVMAGEIRREGALLKELADAGSWLELTKAVALVAHNLGDLDRVIDQWECPKTDPARLRLYKAGSPACPEHHPLFAFVADFNTRFVAPENHRYFPLRRLKCLRRSPDTLLPVGPFHDAWGAALARPGAGLSLDEIADTASALVEGAERLPETTSYARALNGLLETIPGGLGALSKKLTARDARALKAGRLRTLISISRERFEAQWANRAKSELASFLAAA